MIEGMQSEVKIIYLIIIWVVLSAIMIIRDMVQEKKFSGLTLLFLANLTLTYFIGAVSYALPNHTPGGEYLVLLGFRQAVFALGAFCFGNLFLSPWFLQFIAKDRQTVSAIPEDSIESQVKLPMVYFVLGFVFYFILPQFFGDVLTLKSFLYVGSELTVVGICLLCWQANYEKKPMSVKFWLFASFIFPVITVVQMGFLGFGTVMTLAVFVFVLRFMRPRFNVLIICLLVSYLGLSFYQTYMRDRDDIRLIVWDESTKSKDKTEIFLKAVRNPIFFNPFDAEQLDRINGRIDFNYISGTVVTYIATGGAAFSNGQTLLRPLIALVPRVFWPDKPVTSGGSELAAKYTGMIENDGITTVILGMVMEFYVNFATKGVIVAYLILGIFIGVLDTMAGRYLAENSYRKFILWFLPGICFIQPGSMDGAVASTFLGLIMAYIISKFSAGQYKAAIILLAMLVLLLFMMK